jgi:hypothetical protein
MPPHEDTGLLRLEDVAQAMDGHFLWPMCLTELEASVSVPPRAHSWAMLKSLLRSKVQRADEHALRALFAEDFFGYEEPALEEALELAHFYLPFPGAEGEMVMNIGRGVNLARHGVDGIVDISPFSCMNGVVSEAIYRKLSRDFAGFPIRNFYLDGQESDLDRDLGMFLDMARSYRDTKPFQRLYPSRFLQRD